MGDSQFGTSQSQSIKPTPPARASTSANSSQRPPITVIEISSSEDDDVRLIKSSKPAFKSSSREKRPSSSSKQTSLDVSLWNVEPRIIKPPKASNSKDPSNPRSVLSSSANRPTVPGSRRNAFDQSTSSQAAMRFSTTSRPELSKPRSFVDGTSSQPAIMSPKPSNTQSSKQNALVENTSQSVKDKAVAHPSQPTTTPFSQSNFQSGHVKELSKQQFRHSLPSRTLAEKGSATMPKGIVGISSRPSLETNGETLRSARPVVNPVDKRNLDQEEGSSSSSRKPPQPPKDVIKQLNSFSYRATDQSTTSKVPNKPSNPNALPNSKNPVNQRSGETHSHSSSSQSSGLLRNVPSHTVHPKPTSSAPSIQNRLANDIFRKAMASITQSRNEKTRSNKSGVAEPSSSVKKTATELSSLTLGPNPPVNLSTLPQRRKDQSDDALHVNKKRKCEPTVKSNRITQEDRFVELSDQDNQQPTTSTSTLLSSKRAPTNALPSNVGPRQEPIVSASTSKQASTHAVSPRKRLQSKRPVTSMPGSKSGPTPAAPCAIHDIIKNVPIPKAKPRIRPQSPDWTGVPLHRRPLQGREREDEFSSDIQKEWILKNNPDLSTPMGHLIFTEEMNSNQMWENPGIPQIDVLVSDEVREKQLQDPSGNNFLVPPLEFVYTDRLIYRTQERPIPPNWHCECRGNCMNNPDCACRAHQTNKIKQIIASSASNQEYAEFVNEFAEGLKDYEGFAYRSTRKPMHSHAKKPENGDTEARCIKDIFLNAKLPVFECNSLCGCGPDCINRTVGRGRREKLSIEKTVSRGWGVFANHPIPVGRLVTHYSGELITDQMSLERGQQKYDKIGRTYIFDLDPWWIKTIYSQNFFHEGLLVISEDNQKTNQANNATTSASSQNPNAPNGVNSTGFSKRKQRKSISESKRDQEFECIYSVDAFLYGNISRFINHSCSANTSVVPVYIDDGDPTRPIFAMFAQRLIKTGREITTSYSDPNREADEMEQKKRQMEGSSSRYVECKCGAPNCRKTMFA